MAVPTSSTPSRYCVFVVMDRQGRRYKVSGMVPENLEYHNKVSDEVQYLELPCADPIESNEGDLGLASFWVDFWRQPRGVPDSGRLLRVVALEEGGWPDSGRLLREVVLEEGPHPSSSLPGFFQELLQPYSPTILESEDPSPSTPELPGPVHLMDRSVFDILG